MTDHLHFAWFLHDGRPWVEHACLDGDVQTWSPPSPPWRLTAEGGIAPSFSCERCGRHSILGAADRCDVPDGLHRCLSNNDHRAVTRPEADPVVSGRTGAGQ